jgi:transposase
MEKLYCGIDLHSNNGMYAMIDANDRRVYRQKLPNDLPTILTALQPYRRQLQGVVVESTYNWYWLVDGLQEQGYTVHLANPNAIDQYDGLKHADDKTDAFFLATLFKLGILPEGYIYPKKARAVRDLLRKRLMLVRQKTSHVLSFETLVMRQTGVSVSSNDVQKMDESDVAEYFDDPNIILNGQTNIGMIKALKEQIKRLETEILRQTKLEPQFEPLLTMPGIGKILGLTIMLETGDIARFKGAGNYASYCRCVGSKHTSNNKKKGEGNRKNGNKYLAWAFIEAANGAKRYYPEVKAWYQRKLSRAKNNSLATKALACKLCKASYFVMKNQEDFNFEKMFGK